MGQRQSTELGSVFFLNYFSFIFKTNNLNKDNLASNYF